MPAAGARRLSPFGSADQKAIRRRFFGGGHIRREGAVTSMVLKIGTKIQAITAVAVIGITVLIGFASYQR